MRFTGGARRGIVGGVVLGLWLSLLPGAADARPRNPGDSEITAAERDRTRTASEVGRLAGLLARADGDLRRASDRAELAVELYNKSVVDLATATSRATSAMARAAAARREVAVARAGFGRFVRSSYVQGSLVGSSAALIGAKSATDLVERGRLLDYLGTRRLDAVGELDRATVRRANVDSAARQALAVQTAATAAAARAKADAARAVTEARGSVVALRRQRGELEGQLRAARVRLNGLLGERQRYQAWKRAQEAAAAREQARQRRIRAEAAARRAAESRREAEPSAGSRSRRSSSAAAPAELRRGVGGGWTASRGRRAADAALRWLGTRYSWGGGNASGPTYGIDFPGGAGANDSRVRGFDCSGLTLYAWAQVGISLPHYSGYQYRIGRRIPGSQLMPGDLVYWAYDTGDPSSIHHVALYIGGGSVVMAPQSGDVVRIARMWYDGYIGATRPGT